MQTSIRWTMRLAPVVAALLTPPVARAAVFIQCPAPLLTQNATGGSCGAGPCYLDPKNPAASSDPGCVDPEVVDPVTGKPTFFDTCKVRLDPVTGQPSGETTDPTIVCRSITCGDGHVNMADGSDMYVFGFRDVTNAPESLLAGAGFFLGEDGSLTGGAEFAAPTLVARVGQRLYLTLTNVGFRERPDLGDPHTVHFHGFPNAAPVFDGEPMSSFGLNMGASLTYFYDNQYAGTYMWHCHVEAAEHMQMGMLGNLYILPAQDGQAVTHGGQTYTRFAYDDCPTLGTLPLGTPDPMCGTTGYDVMYFLQQASFDPVFHYNDQTYQKLDFANMRDTYAMLNGRGYPDTVNPGVMVNSAGAPSQPLPAIPFTVDAQGVRAPLAIAQGQRLLLHLSSLATESFFTVTVLGIPMRIVGQGAQLLRGPTGINTSYVTGSVTLSGGEAVDVILDTTGVPPGTYFLYTTNLNHLSNDAEDFGGMMTEIVVASAAQ
ncbi:MAG: multicopper oxidase domain-containing protein [Deltaproteobacteria bacterium]|nr:multicopper oxidase domain-containing protein [Deltaproteobacteria bacterium]